MARYQTRREYVDAESVSDLVIEAKENWQALPQWFRDWYEGGGVVIAHNGLYRTGPHQGNLIGLDRWLIRYDDGGIEDIPYDEFELRWEEAAPPPPADTDNVKGGVPRPTKPEAKRGV